MPQEKNPNGYSHYLNAGYKYDNLSNKPTFFYVSTKDRHFGIVSETGMLKIYGIVLGMFSANDCITISQYKKNGEGNFVYSGFTLYSKNLDMLFKAERTQ